MITKEEIEQAAKDWGCITNAGKIGFRLGALWALEKLDPICNDAANLIEQFKRDFTIIPGTHAAIYWPGIDPKFKYVTVDYNGRVDAYSNKPYTMYDHFWTNNDGLFAHFFTVSGFHENWQELIFERPE